MAQNPTAPELTIVLDKERHLRLDFNAAARFEEATGQNMFDKDTWAKPTATMTRALLWAMLIHEDPELTLETVGSMLHFGNVNGITDQMKKAYKNNAPKASDSSRPLM